MHWCFFGDDLMVVCERCMDFFAESDHGPDVAGVNYHEGREAVMPDGRPIRSLERIVQDAQFIADCEVS